MFCKKQCRKLVDSLSSEFPKGPSCWAAFFLRKGNAELFFPPHFYENW